MRTMGVSCFEWFSSAAALGRRARDDAGDHDSRVALLITHRVANIEVVISAEVCYWNW